jgi:hypothetical protein
LVRLPVYVSSVRAARCASPGACGSISAVRWTEGCRLSRPIYPVAVVSHEGARRCVPCPARVRRRRHHNTSLRSPIVDPTQAVTIHDRLDFHAFSASRRPNLFAAALRRCERGIDEAFRFIDLAFGAQRVRKICEHLAQGFLAAPLLEASTHCLVVWIALRKHVPLRTGVENPQHCFQNSACGNRFAPGTSIRNIFLRKVFANPLPLVIAQFQHAHDFTALH